MMRFVLALVLALASLSAFAGGGDDFASRFMRLYAKGTSMTCTTVSPQMMSRIMNVPAAGNEPNVRQVLMQLRSLRIVKLEKPEETEPLFEKALSLLHNNPNRYLPYGNAAQGESKSLWIRRKGKTIVEIVMLDRSDDEGMSIVNFTGNMDETFIGELLRL